MDDFFKGISLIGRSLALWNCVMHIATHLQQSISNLKEHQGGLLERILTHTASDCVEDDMKCYVRELEIQRICCLFLSHVLFEGGDKFTASSHNTSSGATAESTSSDISCVPKYIVDPLDLLLNDVKENCCESHQESYDKFITSIRSLRQDLMNIIALCTESLSLQCQALEVAKQLKQQLESRQIAEGVCSPHVIALITCV